VLSLVPLVPKYNPDNTNNSNQTDWDTTEKLAKAIVRFRDFDDGSGKPHGPFRSLYELNLVPAYTSLNSPAFANAITNFSITGNFPPNASCGDYFSDPGRTSKGNIPMVDNMSNNYRTVNDWESTTLMVNRVSNMLCLRSDSFTVYLQVQAWQNAGTQNATMVAQRRAAFIVDRSGTIGLGQAVLNQLALPGSATVNQTFSAQTPNPSAVVYTIPTK
jgi:hypothetical protein